MPKHKKDKRAKSVVKAIGPEQPEAPPVGAQPASPGGDNKAFQQHDAANRTGSFESTGNHARTSNPGHQ